MANSYVGGEHDFAGNMSTGGPLVLPWPTIAAGDPLDHATDDFAIIFAYIDNQATDGPTMDTAGPTEIDVGVETLGRDKGYGLWTWRATSGSMPDVEISHTTTEEGSAAILVFRGIDPTTGFDATQIRAAVENSINQANPAIDTVTDGAALVLLQLLTHNAITAAGEPAGFTLGPVNVNPGQNNRNMATAYDLDAGTAGTKTPGAWTHTGDTQAALSDGVQFTIALRPAVTAPNEGTAALDVDIAYTATGSSPNSGTADLPVDLALAGAGSSPNSGTAALGIDLAYTATGSAPANGTTDLPVDVGLAATGSSPNAGTADLAIEIGQDATGARTSNGTAAVAAAIELAAAGTAPTVDANEGTASLPVNVALAATGTAPTVPAAEGTAALTLDVDLAAAGSRNATATAEDLGTTIDLTATGGRASQGTSQTPVTIDYAAAGSATPVGQAAIPVDIALAANGARDAAGTASLPVQIAYTASGVAPTGTPQGTGAITVDIGLDAAGARPSQGTAPLDPIQIDLDAAGATPTIATGDLPITVDLVATGTTTTEGQGDLPIQIAYTATGNANGGGTAALPVQIAYTATGTRPSTGTANLPITADLAATGARTATGTAALSVQIDLAATSIPLVPRLNVSHRSGPAVRRHRSGPIQPIGTNMLSIPRNSAERIALPVITTGDPTGSPPQHALTTSPSSSAVPTWTPGSWDPNSSWDPKTGQIWALTAKTGAGQTLDVPAEGDYYLHTRWTVDDEAPVDQTDRIRFT